MLGGRTPSMVAREALRPRNYRAVVRMGRVYSQPLECLRRYLLGRGEYPWRCRLRTPTGPAAPTLYSRHDMFTVNEVFCREDYAFSGPPHTVVDVGSNIGISALYFVTRTPGSRVWLYEPVPRNVERLRLNLAGYEDRYSLSQAAVAARPGRVSFGVEESGRYGGIGVITGASIVVASLGINEVLAEVLESTGRIDVLKVDTEGTELELLEAIHPDLLRRVGALYLETGRRAVPGLEGFATSFRNDTLVLRNR